jgi:hypothetical protein
MMHADKTMVIPAMFPFPVNSDKHGISRDAQPALPYRAVRQIKNFTRRQAMELDRMGSSIHYPGNDISSAVIRVISALICGEMVKIGLLRVLAYALTDSQLLC